MQNINSFEPLVLRSSVVTHCLPLWVFVYFVSQRLLWFCNILCVRFSFVHIPSFYSQSYCCVLKFPHTLHAFSTRVLVAWRYENVSDRKVWLPWYKVKCLQQTLVSSTALSMFMLMCVRFFRTPSQISLLPKIIIMISLFSKVAWLLLCIEMWNSAGFLNVLFWE